MWVDSVSGGMAGSYGPETTCTLTGWGLWKVVTGRMAMMPGLFWRAMASYFVLMIWSRVGLKDVRWRSVDVYVTNGP